MHVVVAEELPRSADRRLRAVQLGGRRRKSATSRPARPIAAGVRSTPVAEIDEPEPEDEDQQHPDAHERRARAGLAEQELDLRGGLAATGRLEGDRGDCGPEDWKEQHAEDRGRRGRARRKPPRGQAIPCPAWPALVQLWSLVSRARR